MRARSKLVEGFRSVIDDGRGHTVVTDLPKDMGGMDTAPTALELAVMALAGCITTIFAMVAKGKGLSFEGMEVIVDAEKPKGERTITSGKIRGIVTSSESEERVRKIWEDTLKICPVGVLFKEACVEFETELEVKRPNHPV